MARGRSFAEDMRAKASPATRVSGPPVPPKPRSPNVEYDAAGNARNTAVGKKSPFAVMKKGNPVPTAYSGTPGSKMLQGARDVEQTLADTYHLGNAAATTPTVLPKNGKKKGGGK